MNLFSFSLHGRSIVRPIALSVALGWMVVLSSCYSFRGGAVPEHLQTISIATVTDNSGFGDASLREYCTETLLQRFRSDNTLQLVDNDGDARLSPTIVRIQDRLVNVQGNDLESQRQMVVAVEVEYVDAVKNRRVFKRTFENYEAYDVANATEERGRAARAAMDRIIDDILLSVVSDW